MFKGNNLWLKTTTGNFNNILKLTHARMSCLTIVSARNLLYAANAGPYHAMSKEILITFSWQLSNLLSSFEAYLEIYSDKEWQETTHWPSIFSLFHPHTHSSLHERPMEIRTNSKGSTPSSLYMNLNHISYVSPLNWPNAHNLLQCYTKKIDEYLGGMDHHLHF